MKALQLGEVQVIRVEEVMLDWDPQFLFPELGEADLAPHMSWLVPRFFTPEGKMRLSVHAFVVRTPHHTILVDTCVGNGKQNPTPGFGNLQTDFLERLKSQAGVGPEDVDYVFCTHFHSDHIGWNTRLVDGRWEPTFPNARYLFHRPEFEYYTGLPAEEQRSSLLEGVLPIAEAGKAELVDGGHQIGDHLTLEPTPGHTPGHCSVRIDTPQGKAVITGDLVHTPAQIVETAWSPRVDYDVPQAIATRKAFIERHAEAGSLVLGTHFAPPTACRFVPDGAGHRPNFD